MKKHINKLSAIQKAAAGIGGAVVVLASAQIFLLEIILSTTLSAVAATVETVRFLMMLTQILKPKKVLTQRQS